MNDSAWTSKDAMALPFELIIMALFPIVPFCFYHLQPALQVFESRSSLKFITLSVPESFENKKGVNAGLALPTTPTLA